MLFNVIFYSIPSFPFLILTKFGAVQCTYFLVQVLSQDSFNESESKKKTKKFITSKSSQLWHKKTNQPNFIHPIFSIFILQSCLRRQESPWLWILDPMCFFWIWTTPQGLVFLVGFLSTLTLTKSGFKRDLLQPFKLSLKALYVFLNIFCLQLEESNGSYKYLFFTNVFISVFNYSKFFNFRKMFEKI